MAKDYVDEGSRWQHNIWAIQTNLRKLLKYLIFQMNLNEGFIKDAIFSLGAILLILPIYVFITGLLDGVIIVSLTLLISLVCGTFAIRFAWIDGGVK